MNDLYKKFGALLKIERERKKISLEDFAEQLKLSPTNLEYIENGDVSLLPSELYFNLFAKSYAEALGIDFSRTLEAIRDDLEDAAKTDEEPSEPSGLEDEVNQEDAVTKTGKENASLIKKFVYLFAAIIVIFGLFMIFNELFLSKNDKPIESETEINQKTMDDNNQVITFANYNWDVPQYHKPDKIKLKLVTKDVCWSTIYADGDTVIFNNLVPGRVYEVEADYRLLVSVGIPSLVDIELNGQPVNLRNPETRRISRVEINQMNLNSFLSSKPRPTSKRIKTNIEKTDNTNAIDKTPSINETSKSENISEDDYSQTDIIKKAEDTTTDKDSIDEF